MKRNFKTKNIIKVKSFSLLFWVLVSSDLSFYLLCPELSFLPSWIVSYYPFYRELLSRLSWWFISFDVSELLSLLSWIVVPSVLSYVSSVINFCLLCWELLLPVCPKFLSILSVILVSIVMSYRLLSWVLFLSVDRAYPFCRELLSLLTSILKKRQNWEKLGVKSWVQLIVEKRMRVNWRQVMPFWQKNVQNLIITFYLSNLRTSEAYRE